MSGGRFLVALRDLTSPENIIKIKFLLKEDLDIDNVKVDNANDDDTGYKLKLSITDFFSKCDQVRKKLRIWSHLLKKSIMENFFFCAV